ncbi:uncharacterized protein N0V89_011656 [Didymosphaeria variabile]|uniref:Uncharacterized protein n=1 Tax=Didymosphaeria variabile TaxID=1932322 RepID=A0A9W8XBP8_9PLEO|nr:uncharacterized protein N0V89_011656 [Didymosphaeria variabile]KAJ4345523.1 hypothetical protein N0V89_011656 [Didymosphaeria variabile]
MESDEVQVQQLISPTKNTSSSLDHPETKSRIGSTSIKSIRTMSYPKNQQSANGAAQTNGSNSADPSTQPSTSPSSPAIQRWMGERPWEEPFHAQGSGSATSGTANSGTSTETEKRS